jgi:hypothetical protein
MMHQRWLRAWLLLLLLWPLAVQAQTTSLTEAQYSVLAADIPKHPTLVGADDQTVATFYNQTAAPDFWVWRAAVTRSEVLYGTSPDGSTFTFQGNGFIGRTQGEFEAWENLYSKGPDPFVPGRPMDSMLPYLPKVRDAINDIFSGTGNAAANRAHMMAMARRKATMAEKLFAGTPGAGTTADPATLTFVGTLSHRDVAHAVRGAPLN